MLAHYGAEKDGQDRIENLQELVNAAESFVREADLQVAGEAEEETGNALTAFLAHAALEAGETQAAEGRAALQLMTVHAAKGLEFHTVFVTGLEEGLFPHENSLSEFDGVEEERRLAYVAITTRAAAALPDACAEPHPARPAALQRCLALSGRVAGRARALAVAAAQRGMVGATGCRGSQPGGAGGSGRAAPVGASGKA